MTNMVSLRTILQEVENERLRLAASALILLATGSPGSNDQVEVLKKAGLLLEELGR